MEHRPGGQNFATIKASTHKLESRDSSEGISLSRKIFPSAAYATNKSQVN